MATINPGADHADTIRSWCGDIAALVRSVGKRVPGGNLTCVCGFGADAWDALFGNPRPAALHPFREFGGQRVAVATPGDILLHIRAEAMDRFELATQLLGALGDAVTVVDEVHGFRNFDQRAMIGFVDGTENPEGRAAVDFTVIGDEDAEFAGGSYVIVQKYLHDMAGWNALAVETQERIIGRTKLADIARAGREAVVLAQLADHARRGRPGSEDPARQHAVRAPGRGRIRHHFIGYARSPAPIEQMLENMFVGRPPGNYDRLLDYSRAVTGSLFFVPSADLLEALADRAAPAAEAAEPEPASSAPHRDGSLKIGSLKGAPS